jgi:hypothetical protein
MQLQQEVAQSPLRASLIRRRLAQRESQRLSQGLLTLEPPPQASAELHDKTLSPRLASQEQEQELPLGPLRKQQPQHQQQLQQSATFLRRSVVAREPLRSLLPEGWVERAGDQPLHRRLARQPQAAAATAPAHQPQRQQPPQLATAAAFPFQQHVSRQQQQQQQQQQPQQQQRVSTWQEDEVAWHALVNLLEELER